MIGVEVHQQPDSDFQGAQIRHDLRTVDVGQPIDSFQLEDYLPSNHQINAMAVNHVVAVTNVDATFCLK